LPIDEELIKQGVTRILVGIGVDPHSDPNFLDTPARVARMYKELLTPNHNSMRVFEEKHDNMVVLRGHEVHGLCPHHLVPVTMRVYLGYIPHARVLGLSKLARACEDILTQPIMQEAYTDAVVQHLHETLAPLGVACVVVGKHGCMYHRGVRSDADVVTSCMKGVFLRHSSAKDEFLRLIGRI
jgi:GTP cyclohydrolase I